MASTQAKTRYRFTRAYNGMAKGSMVPDTFSPGQVATMLQYGRIEAVPDEPAHEPDSAEPVKAIEFSPEDKMMRRGKVRNK